MRHLLGPGTNDDDDDNGLPVDDDEDEELLAEDLEAFLPARQTHLMPSSATGVKL